MVFDDFDPQTDRLPWERFNQIADRARQILKDRSRQEIEYAALAVDWMLSKGNSTNPSPAGALRTYVDIDLFGFDGVEDFRSATWPEFFAALALGLLEEAFLAWQHKTPYYEAGLDSEDDGAAFEKTHYYNRFDAYEFVCEALDAVCMAESLLRESLVAQEIQRKHKKKIELRNKKAAIAKHAPLNQLKKECIRWYLSGSFPSKREAARRFYESLPESRRKLLAPSNAIRTLTQAISDYEKGRLRPDAMP